MFSQCHRAHRYIEQSTALSLIFPQPHRRLTGLDQNSKLSCIYLFTAVYQFGWGPVPWIYISEIPTVRLRSLSVAIGATTQWLFNFVIARSSPSMLATLGKEGYSTYLIFGSLSFLMFLFAFFFVPETKDMFLEDTDEIFRLVELSARMLQEAEIENGPYRHSTRSFTLLGTPRTKPTTPETRRTISEEILRERQLCYARTIRIIYWKIR